VPGRRGGAPGPPARQALEALGYTPGEIDALLADADTDDATAEELIAHALRSARQ
jgi:Holliday junction resolvasome RuvABC DNA-binding subunit